VPSVTDTDCIAHTYSDRYGYGDSYADTLHAYGS
jgi:hypothetical protein